MQIDVYPAWYPRKNDIPVSHYWLQTVLLWKIEVDQSGDIYYISPEWERNFFQKWIIVDEVTDKYKSVHIRSWVASDQFTKMVEEVQAHNDELKSKKAREHTEETKKHLHEWIKKIKSQGIL